MRARWTALGILVGVSMVSSCLDPTEIIVDISTNVACDYVTQNRVAIAVGAPGEDDSGITTSTSLCNPDGNIGSLVITPSGNSNQAVGIRVTLGIDASAQTCQAPGFEGCIVARRSLLYTPHTPLTLPIALESSCIGVPCDPNSTCVNGGCVDAGVTTCNGGVCEVTDASPPPPPCANTTTPVFITNQTAVATPHIARIPNGYAIAWTTPVGTSVRVATYSQDGTVVMSSPVLLVPNLSTAGVGPLGADPTTYATIYNEPATGYVAGIEEPFDGGIASSFSTPGSGPSAGLFYESRLGAFFTAKLFGGQAQFMTWPTATAVGSAMFSAVDAIDVASDGTSYFAVVHTPQVCTIYRCAFDTSNNFTCNTSTPMFQQNACGTFRAAVSITSDFIVALATSGSLSVLTSQLASATSQVDDPNAYVPLVVGATPFRVVWRNGDALVTQSFPALTTETLEATGYKAAGGVGAGFDAIADDPANATSYAVVYWGQGSNAPGIYFMRRCN